MSYYTAALQITHLSCVLTRPQQHQAPSSRCCYDDTAPTSRKTQKYSIGCYGTEHLPTYLPTYHWYLPLVPLWLSLSTFLELLFQPSSFSCSFSLTLVSLDILHLSLLPFSVVYGPTQCPVGLPSPFYQSGSGRPTGSCPGSGPGSPPGSV